MKTRLLLIAASLAIALPTSAQATPDPQIFDLDGDANGIQGTSVQTAPASYAPADILDVTLETTHVAVPVGEDGIDYQATGLRISFHTTEPARAEGPTMLYEVTAEVQGCSFRFGGYLAGPLSQPDEGNAGRTELQREVSGCGGVGLSGPIEEFASSSWTAQLDATTARFVLSMPFSALAGTPIEQLLRPGASLVSLMGWVFANPCNYAEGGGGCNAIHLDHSSMPTLPTFRIGEDMPDDVPCTRGCP